MNMKCLESSDGILVEAHGKVCRVDISIMSPIAKSWDDVLLPMEIS
jgi:hypothetical protein